VNLFGFIDAERAYLPVALLCRMLGVSRSGYSTPGVPRDPSKRSRQDAALSAKIHETHRRSRQTYGSARVHAELRALGSAAVANGLRGSCAKLDCEAACAAQKEREHSPRQEGAGRGPREEELRGYGSRQGVGGGHHVRRYC
jgi:putative transposase